MAKRSDKLTITIARYKDPVWGRLCLGTGRWSFNFGHWSLIVEAWFLRNGGLHYS